jgi:hypothetical protein
MFETESVLIVDYEMMSPISDYLPTLFGNGNHCWFAPGHRNQMELHLRSAQFDDEIGTGVCSDSSRWQLNNLTIKSFLTPQSLSVPNVASTCQVTDVSRRA